jgi:hypothetical protein
MKKLLLFAISSLAANLSFGQYTPSWPVNGQLHTVQAGYVGIGTKSTNGATNTPLPNFNLHLHGTADYSEEASTANGLMQNESDPKPTSGTEKALLNYGKTTRLGLTNTTTGMLSTDGVVLRMSGNSFTLANREAGNITLSVPTVSMVFNNASSRIEVGSTGATPTTECAKFNVATGTNANGLYIHNTGTGNYGISVRTAVNTNDAIRVMGIDGSLNKKNFAVKGNGEVFARKYTTTANNIPDYVFDPSYKLMSLNELQSYITTNKHLPNIPSAKEYEERGELDLGELNRMLLEKVEELTLYILQLEERTKALENK